MFHPDGPSIFELARQALSSTTKGYDLLAPKFEYTPFRTPDELIEPLVAEAARVPFGTALDCCCGTGAIARALRRHAGERVVGIDLSEGMLEEARRLAGQQPGLAPVEFHQGDALALDGSETYDVIVTAGAFGHILPPDQERFLDGVWESLNPGGRFLFITADRPSMTSVSYWLSRGFNAAMHVRNALWDPPFIMFYLTFPLDRALRMCAARGFELATVKPGVEARDPSRAVIVSARRPSGR